MQTRDAVEGLHNFRACMNCLEIPQPSSCLHEAMLTPKTALQTGKKVASNL